MPGSVQTHAGLVIPYGGAPQHADVPRKPRAATLPPMLKKLLYWLIAIACVLHAVALVFQSQAFLPGRPW